jgi:hypothetical protein
MQRLSANSPVASPIRVAYGKSSPLARVAEEAAVPLVQPTTNGLSPGEKLVEVETPRPSDEMSKAPRLAALENGDSTAAAAPAVAGSMSPPAIERKPVANGKQPAVIEETMKTIEI